jgi:hypothetical protein
MKVSQRRKWRKKSRPYIASAIAGGLPSAGSAYFSGRLARDPHRLKHAAIWGLGGALGGLASYYALRPRKRS